MLMEKRDLYDENKKLTGETMYKGEVIPENRYIIVVLVYIQNSKGQFLIQKRSKNKNGLYATTGGHPKSGETSLQGILTEVKEEIGLDLDPNSLKLYFSKRFDSERVFCDAYYIKMDIDDINSLKLQKEEVESVEWFYIDEIRKLKKENKYFGNHYEELELLMNWLKDNN